MHKYTFCILFWIIGWLMLFSTSSSAQQSASFTLNRWSMSNAGGIAVSGTFQLKESAMGGVAVGTSASATFTLNGGMMITTVEDSSRARSILPTFFVVQQNYPNPFNPTTTIQFSIPKTSEVSVHIYNALGQLIRTYSLGTKQQGQHRVVWDGKDQQGKQAPNGMYIYQVSAAEFTEVRRMLLVK